MQFEKLRSVIFPMAFTVENKVKMQRENLKKNLYEMNDLDPTRMRAAKPFFYEDYVLYFHKILQEGSTFYWEEKDREEISAWQLDTLVFDEVVTKYPDHAVKSLLSLLRYAITIHIVNSYVNHMRILSIFWCD
jgi:hypothetical protein